jgi:hypothetical protein
MIDFTKIATRSDKGEYYSPPTEGGKTRFLLGATDKLRRYYFPLAPTLSRKGRGSSAPRHPWTKSPRIQKI